MRLKPRAKRLHASHGYAVALFAEFNDQVKINVQYRNPEDALAALLNLIHSQPFIDRICKLPGYAPDNLGEITTLVQLIAEDI